MVQNRMAVIKNKRLTNFFVKQAGFGLIEIIAGVAIISIFIFGLTAVSRLALRLNEKNVQNIKAGFLLEEGIEAVKILRDGGWTANIAALGVNVPYYFDFNGSAWKATTTNVFIDGVFERRFIVADVLRDASDDIASLGGPDPNTKKISISVSWLARAGTTTETLSTYITNLFNN